MLIDRRDGPQELTIGPGRTSQTICSPGIVAFGSAAVRSTYPTSQDGRLFRFIWETTPYDLPGPLSWSTSDPTAA